MSLIQFNHIFIYCCYLILFYFELWVLINIDRKIKISSSVKAVVYLGGFILQTFILLLSLHFVAGKHLLYALFSTVDKSVIIQDPQDYLRVLWESGLSLTTLVSILLLFFYIHFLFSGMLRSEEYINYCYFVLLSLYLIVISLIVFVHDILFYHWDIFYSEKMFDFQPELLMWFLHYKNEYWDLILFLTLIFVLYAFMFFGSNNYAELIKFNSFWRFLPFGVFSIYSLYLFGGESLIRDLWLVCLCFISGEFLVFSKLCFEKFKKYKYYLN